VTQQLAGFAVDKMQPTAGRTTHRFVFISVRTRARPVLHFKIGFGADEDQIHSILIGASVGKHDLSRGYADVEIRIRMLSVHFY
jgi:hypothetical protein